MPQPMQIHRAPDGRIFFNEINGKLKVWKPDTREVVEAGGIPVFTQQENGFLGFALDPNFNRNRFIYLLYSPTNFAGQRLSRFVMGGDRLDTASEKVILEVPEQRRECCHHAGKVAFGPDGCLYFSLGDNTNPFGSDGFAPIDEQPGREPWDAQKSSANMNDLRGGICRIKIQPDGTYTIPKGNLFPPGLPGTRPEIYVKGCRNPWRFNFDWKTGHLYFGDVGPDANGDTDRGSRGYDEIGQVRRAGFFGWPYFIGPNRPYADYDFAAKKPGGRFDPLQPVNLSPNNTGITNLPPAQPAFLSWPYGDSEAFPSLGKGGRTACAGPVFHYQSRFKRTGGFPEHFDNCLLFFDWQRPFIKWARLDKKSNLIGVEDFTDAVLVANGDGAKNASGRLVIKRPVDAYFGPDGCLYLLDYGETWGVNADAKLLKISYIHGNVPPVAVAQATPAVGREPLTVQLSSAGTLDHDKDRLKLEWRLFPGDQLISTGANPPLTIEQPGNYVVKLTARDSRGAQGSTSLPLLVGNAPPEVRFIEPQDGDFFTPGQTVRFKVAVRDHEDGDSATNDELMDGRTTVSARWSKGAGDQETVDPGLALMRQSDCFNCHTVESKIVGPSFLDIAERYRGQAGALDLSVQRVMKGSQAVWGEAPMLAHEHFSADQVRAMVRWIYALERGKTGLATAKGLFGNIEAPRDKSNQLGVLEATYTDLGRDKVAPLAGKAVVKLRSRRLEAEHNDGQEGLKTQGTVLGSIAHGHHIRYANLNLSDSESVTCRVSSGGVGGKIELRQGSPTGDLLATLEVRNTGGWDKFVEVNAPLKPAGQRGDVHVVFVNPGKGGLMNIDWVQFNAR